MAELHLIGQIVGGWGFPRRRLFCKWGLHVGGAWTLLGGVGSGQTHVDDPQAGDVAFWGHPLDLHLATKGLQGWPTLLLEVWHLDRWGRAGVLGYGAVPVPSSPGSHDLTCLTWTPVGGSWRDRLAGAVLGGGPRLLSPEGAALGAAERFRLRTRSSGSVRVQLGVLPRNLGRFGVSC